jgi:hypothetical protein
MPPLLTLRKRRPLFSLRFGWHKRAMTGLPAALLSIAVLAAFALTGGGLWLIFRRRVFKQGALMMIMAAVLIGNVLVWTL